MKDKLYKHHKTARYFIVKKVAIIFAIALTLSLSIGLPLALRAHSKSAIVLIQK